MVRTASSMSSAACRCADGGWPMGSGTWSPFGSVGGTRPRNNRASSISMCARATGSDGSEPMSTDSRSRANSRRLKAVDNAAGAYSTTADRCRGEAPSTRCAAVTMDELSCRAANVLAAIPSSPHGCNCARLSGCIGAPTTACTPALDIWNSLAARPPRRPTSRCRIKI
jgi:hypothetical protein